MKKIIILFISFIWIIGSVSIQAVAGQRAAQHGMAYKIKPINVVDFKVDDQAQYAAIWQKQKGGAIWQARHGMSDAQYQQTVAKLKDKGFRVVHVSGGNVNGAVKFVAIWTETKNIAWQAQHDLTSDQYHELFNKLIAEGYRLTSLSDYQVYGEARYAAVWQKENRLSSEQDQQRLATSRYQKTFDELAEKGYRLIHVNEHGTDEKDRYGAIWWKRHSVGLTNFQDQAIFKRSEQVSRNRNNQVFRKVGNTSIFQ